MHSRQAQSRRSHLPLQFPHPFFPTHLEQVKPRHSPGRNHLFRWAWLLLCMLTVEEAEIVLQTEKQFPALQTILCQDSRVFPSPFQPPSPPGTSLKESSPRNVCEADITAAETQHSCNTDDLFGYVDFPVGHHSCQISARAKTNIQCGFVECV